MILAAGGGTRFTGATHKLLAPFRGRPVVAWAIDHACAAGLDATVVVQGAVALDALGPSVGDEVVVLDNPRWHEGQATSLAAALTWAGEHDIDAVVVGLGDQPLVPTSAWQAVAVADPAATIAVATYDGRRGHPVRLARAVWPLVPTGGDTGARQLLAEREDLVVEIPCDGLPVDIDTPEDIERWS